MLGACASKSEAPPEQGGGPSAGSSEMAQARELFATRCTPCHGADGRGNGPASASLVPRPRDFHDKSWQAAISNERIERTIQYGGASVGKSAAMPANPDLSPGVVRALRELIRGMGG
ncbi:MAG TPA: c-type cytochrome [Haliangiales bacterium]|nr:c-type cytochrome [Haliangiales bacterium]